MQKFFLAVSFLLLIAGCSDSKIRVAEKTTPEKVLSLNDVRLASLSGDRIDLPAYQGKTVFINFWATWCKPCIGEMPSLQRLMEKFKGRDIVFLFASDEPADVITDFKRETSYPMEFVQAENLAELNIMGLPTTFVFNKKGQLAFSEIGARNWNSDEIVAEINKIINQ